MLFVEQAIKYFPSEALLRAVADYF